MRIKCSALIAAFSAALLWTTPAFPHHSNVAFEVNKVVTLTGVVTDFRWANPHTWIGINVDDGKGGKAFWQIEGRAPGVLMRAGWAPKIIKPGDTITIDYSPAKDGSHTGLVARVTKADGTILPNAPPAEQ